MARIQGIAGGMSGKMGNAVFRQRGGQTIIAQYQPIVKNPNTALQQNARASFKLATQLAAIMSQAMGTGGVINRPARLTARNVFVARNFPFITTTRTENTTVANIAMEKVQLTQSMKQFGNMVLNTSETIIKGTVNGLPSLGSGNMSAKVVLVGYEELENGSLRAYVHSMIDVPKTQSEGELPKFEFTFQNLPRAAKFTVLSYGMLELSSGKAKVDYNNIHTPSDANFISSVVIDQSITDGSMEVTNTIGANATTQAE